MTKSPLRGAAVMAALFCTATLLSAAVPPAENLLPADTLGFFTVPDCNALRAASKVSPQLMFWNDPAMKPFHDKFMNKLSEQYTAPLEKELGLKVDDFADLLQGQFTLALTLNGSNLHDDIPPGFVLLLDTTTKSDQLKTNLAALTKKMTDDGRTIRTEKIRGIPFTVVTLSTNELAGIFGPPKNVSEIGKEQKPTQPVDIYFAQVDSLLIAANSSKILDAVAAHLSGGSVPALVDDPVFAADKVSQFRDAPTYYGWFNGKLFFNQLASMPEDSDSDPGAMTPKFSAAKILGATGLGGIKSASFAVREAREGSTASFHISVPASERNGLIKILALSAKDSSPPAFVPADVMKFSRIRLDGKQAWDELLKMAGGISPQVLGMINGGIDTANATAQQKDPSFDLRKNLFGNLGDDIVSYGKAPGGDTAEDMKNAPGIVLIATPNPDQMIQAVKVVAGMVSPQDPAAATPRDYHGHKIYSIGLRPQRAPGGKSIPQPPLLLSSASGYLAITTDEGSLEEFLRSGDGNVKPLRENPALGDAAAHIGGMNAGLFSYSNARDAMRISFRQMKNAATSDPAMKMLPPAMHDWVDFSLLPDYDTVSKYFYISVFSAGATDDGLNVKAFNPRPPQLD
ncbi:MAG TPA: hypothetical protein VK742_21100 [Candidatus Sulfotelmatobacter sp.]|nr:hypothetical protein [Candidatus Sulfotelmatobacter sp.]